MKPGLVVLRAGPLLTVQDLGRPGLGRLGVTRSGAMDPLALRVANLLLGNAGNAPALEITGAGARIRIEQETSIALSGADLEAFIDDRPAAAWAAHAVRPGDILTLRRRVRGARAYLAVPGGLDVSPALGSASTDLVAVFGGSGGRPLRAGDALAFAGRLSATEPRSREAAATLGALVEHAYGGGNLLRFVPSRDPALEDDAPATFSSGLYRVTPRSNRMGFRLDGPEVPVRAPADRLSEPLAPHAIQIPPDGQPILLMADSQTVGGYACLGHLARADVARAAQLFVGDEVCFRPVTREEAQAAAEDLEQALARALSCWQRAAFP